MTDGSAGLAATWRSYLPDHVVRMLPASGAIEPPLAQRTDAVVLFADVVGFTAMGAVIGLMR